MSGHDMKLFSIPIYNVKRKYTENNLAPYRTEFMRDRDRIMYATAFRRLAGKTQIYTVGSDDHKRNRLTHTLEVAQIARTIAKGLGLNEELTEAIALAHDFGHTPFGHAGEQMLHEIMLPNSHVIRVSPFYGNSVEMIKNRFELEANSNMEYFNYAFGFKHNLQSVRVATVLEDSYRDDKGNNIGLNLTNYTLYGMMVHSKIKYSSDSEYPNFHLQFKREQLVRHDSDENNKEAWSFEAYIVAIADEFSQWHHDLEDALRGGVLPLDKICETIKDALGSCLFSEDLEVLDKIKSEQYSKDRKYIADLSHIVVNTLVNDLISNSQSRFEEIRQELEGKNINSAEEVFAKYDELDLKYKKDDIIVNSNKISPDDFKGIIRGSVHHSRNVERMNAKGQYIIRKLFEAYYSHPQQLPDGPILHMMVDAKIAGFESIDKAKREGFGKIRVEFEKVMKNPSIYFQCILMRRICDHIASMTDRYAIEEYNNLYG